MAALLVLLYSCSWAQPAEFDKVLLPAEKDWLKQHSEWRLGVDPAWPPFEMINDEGDYIGMGADYIALVAQRLGVTATVLPGLFWSEVIDKAKNSEADVLPVVTHTFERAAYLNFSDV
ncbi:MAG: transporter substrate-binding domain-containing protein, partial [Candidatus Omnitrophota bacterium]